MTEQVSLRGYISIINPLLLIFIVPIYEGIIFRGCLFGAFAYWFNDNICWSAIVTSRVFVVTHTQYVDMMTLFLLFLISLVLSVARVKSKSLLIPITPHIAMNGIGLGFQYLIAN
ncbi:CPBP family intramembrane glutamic endopeptidase [Yersinia nurmii]|uniref:CPBP family intramembrane glutamic endopeptidase n=1 Tax=Yersinia nurmii TaxID=685706 RepID=UPI00338EBF89